MKSTALESPQPLVAAPWAGQPLRATLMLLAWPCAVLGLSLATGVDVPPLLLYGLAGCVGVAVMKRSLADPEWALALLALYLPVGRQYVAYVAPGINGSNLLWMLVFLAWAMEASRRDGLILVRTRATRPVLWWFGLSSLSFLTTLVTEGPDPLLDATAYIRGWGDSLLIFLAFSSLLRDGAMARRMAVYMMLGSAIVVLLGLQEWMDKRWYESIEKARLLGPQLQPNDFGAFLVYSASPFIGLFLMSWQRLLSWPLVLYFLLMLRLLFATFSRGGYIGFGAAFLAAGLLRGRLFLVLALALGVGAATLFPQLLPSSVQDRVAQSHQESAGGDGEELDDSAETRLILWHAALEMSKESPLLGKGFAMFPRLKAYYTEVPVREADNHNMFLYIMSQMGVPALLAFLGVVAHTAWSGMQVYRRASDLFGRALGVGGVAMAGGVVGINMFGSRMTDTCTMAYFWIYLAVLACMRADLERAAAQEDTRRAGDEAPDPEEEPA